MDYKTYLNSYTTNFEKNKILIKNELQGAIDSNLIFKAAFDDLVEILDKKIKVIKKQFKRFELVEITYDDFYNERKRYNPEDSIKHMLEPEGFIPKFYNEKARLKDLKISYEEFIELLGEYHVLENITPYLFNNKDKIKASYEVNKLESLDFNFTEVKNTDKKLNIRQSTNITDSSWGPKEEYWRSLLESFTLEEKTVLMHLYYQNRTNIQRPEFIKLNIIVGGLFNIEVLEGTHKNTGFYKIVCNGLDYFKPSKKKELLKSLNKKIIPFNMKVINERLKFEMFNTK